MKHIKRFENVENKPQKTYTLEEVIDILEDLQMSVEYNNSEDADDVRFDIKSEISGLITTIKNK